MTVFDDATSCCSSLVVAWIFGQYIGRSHHCETAAAAAAATFQHAG